MAGYSKARFVNLSPTEDEELTCGICLDIFNKPIVVNCCRQMYCDDCITDWLKSNQTCPNDRRPLAADDLTEPPRMVQNMISKLNLHCDFEEYGCKQVTTIDGLPSHKANCLFNPDRLCKNCGLKFIGETNHDCIFNLKALNMSLNDEIVSVKSNKSDILNMTLSSARRYMASNEEPIIRVNRYIEVEQLAEIKSLTRRAIQDYSSYEEISKFICRSLNDSDSIHTWHVIVYPKGCGESWVFYDKYYVDMCFGKMRFEIFTGGKKDNE